MRAAKLCSVGDCTNVQPCPTPGHSNRPWATSRRRERSTLSGSAQQKRARFVIDRDDTVCHVCGFPGANEADHVIPLAQGGVDDVSNMAPVHGPASDPTTCHGRKTYAEAQVA